MSLTPVAESERIQSLDVMRGFAVLGILIVNAAFFAAPWQTALNPGLPPLAVTEETRWSWLAMHVFFEAKCITLFSMLFGVSIYLVGGERSDKPRGALLRRRLFWLVIFGLIHGLLIWFGDILLNYALSGFLVMLARSWRARTLMIVGVILYVLAVLMSGMLGFLLPHIPPDQLTEMKAQMWAPPEGEVSRQIEAYQAGFLSALNENVWSWVMFASNALLGLVIRSVGVMMIGLALFKWGFMSARSPAWIYLLMLAVGAGAFALIARQALHDASTDFSFSAMMGGGMIVNAALSIFGSLFYVSLFALAVKGGVALVTGPLSAVGRMAFTNYITQSLIMTTIFWGGRGFGLYGEVDRPSLWVIVVAIWVAQLIWSPLWLSRFNMGPLEWVWRRLSYGHPVNINKGSASA